MAVRGIFFSHQSVVGDRTMDLPSRLLTNSYTGQAPFTALSAGMPKDSVQDTSYSWGEDDQILNHTLTTASALINATLIDVADTNIWIPFSIVQNMNTGEHMLITAISGNTITVARGFQGTTPVAVGSGNRLQLVGNAFPEGSRGANSIMTNGSTLTSYVQIFKAAWGVSGSANAVKYNLGSKLAESKAQAMQQLTESMEMAALFGRPSVSNLTTPDGVQEVRTTMGLNYAIRTNGGNVTVAAANSVAGRLNLDVLQTFLRRIFDRNIKGQPNERLCFTGSEFVQMIQKMVMDLGSYNYSVKESEFGINVHTLITPNGNLNLLTHPLFVANPQLQRELMVYHPGGIRRKMFRDFQVTPRGQANQPNALDAETGDVLIEMGYEIKGAKSMGILTGTTSAGGLAALPNS